MVNEIQEQRQVFTESAVTNKAGKLLPEPPKVQVRT